MLKLLYYTSVSVFSISYVMCMLFTLAQEPSKGKIIFTALACVVAAIAAIYSEKE